MDYSNFSLTDFMRDDDFCEWVTNPTPDTELFWQEWMMNHPEKKPVIAQARTVLLYVDFKKTPSSEIDDEKILYRIKATLQKDQESPNVQRFPKQVSRPAPSSKVVPVKKRMAGWQKIAAVFVGAIFMATVAYYLISGTAPDVYYTTVYGETSTIVLPDHSEVLLNGNSSLRLSSDWKDGQTREVWLTGEAYFKVQEMALQNTSDVSSEDKSENLVKFIVHTDALDIEVVGTQFNVNTRREKTEVMLSSGKVRLKIEDQDEVVMQPGEMVGYSPNDQQLLRKIVNPEVYSSWKNNHLILDEVPLQKVAEILKDTYGIEVVFEDALLSEKIFKGVFPSDNVEVLLTALSDIYNVRISKTEKKIIFHKE